MTKNGNLTQYQIKELKDDVEGLKSDMKRVLENHLPHLSADIAKTMSGITNNRRESRLLSVLNLGAIILALVIQKVFL